MRGEYRCGKCGVFREKVEHNCNDERRRPGTPEEPEGGHDNHTSESSEEGGDIPPPPTSSYPHNPAGGKHGLDRGQRGCGVAKSRILAAPVMAATAERDIDLWCPNCPYGNKRNARGAGRPRAPLCQRCSRLDPAQPTGGELIMKKVCSVAGCLNTVHGRHFCKSHGRKQYSIDGGANQYVHDLFVKDGARRSSTASIEYVALRKGGKTVAAATAGASSCKKRKTTKKVASSLIVGKVNNAQYRTLPSGTLQKLCSTEACNSFSVKRGLCNMHGGPDKCVAPGCTTNAKARGYVVSL